MPCLKQNPKPGCLQTAPDAHFKFHAVRALSVCLERIHQALAAAAGGSNTAAAGSSMEAAAAGSDAGAEALGVALAVEGANAAAEEGSPSNAGSAGAAAALPLITEGLRDELKAVLWSAWEVGGACHCCSHGLSAVWLLLLLLVHIAVGAAAWLLFSYCVAAIGSLLGFF